MAEMMTPEQVIRALNLIPLPNEGGYYRETYRCEEVVPAESLHGRYGGERSHCTAIYYLITPDAFSALHRVKSDEIFHFYAGDPVEMLQIHPDGSHTLTTIGPDIAVGQVPQLLAPRGIWQGTRLVELGSWALLGCTVSPGFDFADYEHGHRTELIQTYPGCQDLIERFTRP